jgi:hypothetical protein
MRQLQATILLLLFVATFGRCFAEQYGAISGSDLACCVVHTECCPDEDPEHDDEERTPDCPICLIIDHSGFVTAGQTDLAPPVFTEISSLFAIEAWNFYPLNLLSGLSEPEEPDIPDPPERQSLSLTELVLLSAPVRGPAKA